MNYANNNLMTIEIQHLCKLSIVNHYLKIKSKTFLIDQNRKIILSEKLFNRR